MSSQLEQLLGYLERDGVTEVVVGAGKTITMRTAKGMTNLTARPLSADQLASMIRGSEVAALVPDRDGESQPQDVKVGRRRALAHVTKRGELITIVLQRSAEAGQPLGTMPLARVAAAADTPRPKSPTAAPRAKSPTAAPRSKGTTVAPRTKGTTAAPRSKGTTAAPRTKPATKSPRTKAPSVTPPSGRARAQRASAFDSYAFDDEIELGGAASAPPRPLVEAHTSSFRGIDLDQSLGDIDLESTRPMPTTPLPRTPPPAFNDDIELALNDAGTSHQAPRAPDVSLGYARTMPMPPPPGPAASPASAFGLSLDLEEEAFEPLPASTTVSLPTVARPPMAMAAPIARAAPGAHDVHTAQTTRVPTIAYAPQVAPTASPSARAPASRPPASPGAARAFAALLQAARERGATDLHVSAARVTTIRVGGELVALDANAQPLTSAVASDLLAALLDDAQYARLESVGYIDLALDAPGGGRLRANISKQQQGLKGTFRLALAAPATLAELGLPADLGKVVQHHQGLVVIAGPSGHGKTTTLAALVDSINSTRAHHILTIEDPIEIVHPRKQAVVSQREVGRDTMSFARGLKASLREDPDVIVIGELRDRESVEIALTAAETGHLVIATMSTPSAAKTIDRLVDMFPPEDHNQVRASVAGALRAIVAQRLLPKRGGGGVIPAVELVTGVLPLAVMIREDKLYQLPNLMQRGRAFGMIRFDESLAEHVRAGRLDEETALAAAESKKDLAAVLRPAQAPQAQPQPKTSPLWGFGKKEPK